MDIDEEVVRKSECQISDRFEPIRVRCVPLAQAKMSLLGLGSHASWMMPTPQDHQAGKMHHLTKDVGLLAMCIAEWCRHMYSLYTIGIGNKLNRGL